MTRKESLGGEGKGQEHSGSSVQMQLVFFYYILVTTTPLGLAAIFCVEGLTYQLLNTSMSRTVSLLCICIEKLNHQFNVTNVALMELVSSKCNEAGSTTLYYSYTPEDRQPGFVQILEKYGRSWNLM